jgi:valyl-tRNA synthetase
MNNLTMDFFDFYKELLEFVNETKNQYSIPKNQKVGVCLNIQQKELSLKDVFIAYNHSLLIKKNLTNADVYYSLFELLYRDRPFVYRQIGEYMVFISVDKLELKEYLSKIESDITHYKTQLDKINRQLSNSDFINKADKLKVESEFKKKKDFENKLSNLNNAVLLNSLRKEYSCLLEKFTTFSSIKDHIEYIRDLSFTGELYEKEYFDYVYGKEITKEEILKLYETTI